MDENGVIQEFMKYLYEYSIVKTDFKIICFSYFVEYLCGSIYKLIFKTFEILKNSNPRTAVSGGLSSGEQNVV